MPLSKLFLSSNIKLCLLCGREIFRNEKESSFSGRGWTTLQHQAKQWARIPLSSEDQKFLSTQVHTQVKDSNKPFGTCHASCRTDFQTRLSTHIEKHGFIEEVTYVVTNLDVEDSMLDSNETVAERARRSTSNYLKVLSIFLNLYDF